MAAELQHSDEKGPSPRAIMPPYLVLRGFLDEDTAAGLLAYTLGRQSEFTPSRLGSKQVDESFRVSSVIRELGEYRARLETRIFGLLPRLVAELGTPPIEAATLETELVAHGDGAFYKRHTDTQTARYNEVDKIRVLSGVYYFHAEPKAFSGGALRLYAVGGTAGENFVDIEPVHNSLLVFPSWAPHEVMPVRCPSKRFADSRFAVNCWIRRPKAR